TVSIPPPPASNQSEQCISPTFRGSILDADPPAQGVKIARRNTILGIFAWHAINTTPAFRVAGGCAAGDKKTNQNNPFRRCIPP
ncbi:MAG: hypothetical protein WAU53_08920, partial [Rhodoplanes sp.]